MAYPPTCASTLRRLREITVLPSIDKVGDMTAEKLDERQAEIDTLIGMYTDQISKDYQACRLDKERLILLSHLSQEQSIEVLEANLKLARDMASHQIHVKQSVEQEIMRNHSEMEKHVFEMLERNRKWLPWHGTAYAVPQYRGSTRFFFFAPSERMNVIG